jgi:hypothetical protein
MKNKELIKQRILEEEDFIYCPRLGNSVKRLIETNSEGIDEQRMSRVLLVSVDEIGIIYASAIKKIKKSLGL